MERGEDKNLIHRLEEQYDLCKQVRMHPGLLLMVALKLMRELHKEKKLEYVRKLCCEARTFSAISHGEDSTIHAKIKKICEAAEDKNKLSSVLDSLLLEEDHA